MDSVAEDKEALIHYKAHPTPQEETYPELDELAREIIGRVADKWTRCSL